MKSFIEFIIFQTLYFLWGIPIFYSVKSGMPPWEAALCDVGFLVVGSIYLGHRQFKRESTPAVDKEGGER